MAAWNECHEPGGMTSHTPEYAMGIWGWVLGLVASNRCRFSLPQR